ncbi:MAG: EAL domain-containing response regulator [Oligoflexia bacterium]|nr:EAL domain-containing response regulator [Oligoflexia bacterium]
MARCSRSAIVVDDDPLLQRLVCSLMERRGFDVRGAISVAQAREKLSEGDADVIVLDLALGDEDGVDVLEHLASLGSSAAILPVSGFDRRVLRSAVHLGRALGLNVLEPLRKPFTSAQLTEALDAIPVNLLPVAESELAQALTDDRLLLRYQPKIHLQTGRIVGAEALARWTDARRGPVSPDHFIAIAEEGELIHRLTRRVLDVALADCAAWRSAGHDVGVAVNISARSLSDPDLPAQLEDAVHQVGLPPNALTLEVTETVAMRDVDTTMKLLTRLRLRGFALSLDDFGTGYSSLVELHRMPFSELKIDQSFVTRLDKDPDAAIITSAMIALGHALGLEIIAEGVEDESVAQALREMGCDHAQGYLYDHALDATAFRQRLAAD